MPLAIQLLLKKVHYRLNSRRAIYLDARKDSERSEIKTFDVLSNPEFLAEGTAINDLLYPDRVLIGGENQLSINA